jgi:hypothetical protein
MSSRWIRFFATTLGLLLVSSSVRAADSCLAPCARIPREQRYVSTGGPIPLPAGQLGGTLLTTPAATLAMGKAKRVLVVDATVTSGAAPPAPLPMVLTMAANANGVPMEPTIPWGVVMDCGGSAMSIIAPLVGCTLSATFWLDLDQAETASPGTFIGMPLTVILKGGNAAGAGGMPVYASMGVHLEKRK